jgi:uncharacterized membrane protein HdeD (DUF308 family)
MMAFSNATYAPTRANGWLLAIIGVIAVIAGILALVFPGLTLLNLILIFGWFAIIGGIVQIVHAFGGGRPLEGRILLALWGIVTLGLGVIALVAPGITLGAFVLLLAAYFFITGVLQVIAAFRGHLHGWLLLWGIIGIIAGIVAVAYPGAAAFSLAIIFGIYAILGGLSAIVAGIHILRHQSATDTPAAFRRAG